MKLLCFQFAYSLSENLRNFHFLSIINDKNFKNLANYIELLKTQRLFPLQSLKRSYPSISSFKSNLRNTVAVLLIGSNMIQRKLISRRPRNFLFDLYCGTWSVLESI